MCCCLYGTILNSPQSVGAFVIYVGIVRARISVPHTNRARRLVAKRADVYSTPADLNS